MRSLGEEKRVRKEPNGELDRFSKLMFGANRRREGNKKDESSSQEIPNRGFMFGAHQHREGRRKTESSSQEIPNREFMFGADQHRERRKKNESNSQVMTDRKLMFGADQHREEHTKNESSSQEFQDRKLMVGADQHREEHTMNGSSSQEFLGQNEAPPSNRKPNQFDNWFFSSRRKEEEYSTPTPQNQLEQQIGNLLNNVDLGLLMETVDMLVETTKQYKPLLKGISPMFNQFIKKFKSK